MIELTKLGGIRFVINTDLIETIEQTPDTVITVASGRKYVVRESVDEVLDEIVNNRLDFGGRRTARTISIVHRSREVADSSADGAAE